jgi:outer membrane protein OmpA-like peptidoglycan-associated protein
MRFFILIISSLATLPAYAQMQQGYSTGQPSIVVDRSVLEDLKGYEPPPMFEDSEASKPVTPIKTPTLTAPNAETLLNHPVENLRVLTERNSEAKKTIPAKTSLKTNNAAQKKVEEKTSSLTKKAIEKESKLEIKKKTEIKKDIAKQTISEPSTPSKPVTPAYKPKASPTMPAMPAISVEKDSLPPLPDLNSTEIVMPAPSIGEKMIDAALERQIEKDNEKIKEKLALEKLGSNKKAKENVTKTTKETSHRISNNSLQFEEGKMEMTAKLEDQIRKSILPEITNDVSSRIQILSFASSPDKSEASAKRISLARALTVRDALKKFNVDVSRIDVRALVSNPPMPTDKVDIVLLK